MSDENKHNLFYFESTSMKQLFESMEEWQNANQKRLLSISIQKDDNNYCCIALSNPSEVLLCDFNGYALATKDDYGQRILRVAS